MRKLDQVTGYPDLSLLLLDSFSSHQIWWLRFLQLIITTTPTHQTCLMNMHIHTTRPWLWTMTRQCHHLILPSNWCTIICVDLNYLTFQVSAVNAVLQYLPTPPTLAWIVSEHAWMSRKESQNSWWHRGARIVSDTCNRQIPGSWRRMKVKSWWHCCCVNWRFLILLITPVNLW